MGFEFAFYKRPWLASAVRSLATVLAAQQDSAIVDDAASDLLDLLRSDAKGSGGRDSQGSEALVERIRDYIHANLGRRLRLDDIHATSDRSLTSTRACFRQATGMPIHAYIMAARAERARQLIRRDSDLGQIALQVGLSDQSHLNRLFKKYFAITPGQYRAGL